MADRIVKSVVLHKAPHQVWPAITDAKAFGTWFGAEFDGSFTPGAHVTGRITPTQMDPEVAKAQEPHKGMPIDLTIERIDPLRHFSFRWNPLAIERSVERTKEPSSVLSWTMRTRSPSSAPPLEREDGSTAITPTVLPALRHAATRAAHSEDLPTPGGPVTPTT